METVTKSPGPLITIVGETASGKSALAFELAKRFNGEIICADSRTVYKGMDIGTAKPNKIERRTIAHYGLDVALPGQAGQAFTVADFQKLAKDTISGILERKKLPIIVGGSGLYINSVIFNFEFLPAGDGAERAKLEKLSIEELQQKLQALSIPLPENSQNKRYLVRAVERGGRPPRQTERKNTLVLGLSVPRQELEKRIQERLQQMLDNGVVDETRRLAETYGYDCEQFKGSVYGQLVPYIKGEISLVQAIQNTVTSDLQLAKKQRTWFKRNPRIQWITSHNDAEKLVAQFIAAQPAESQNIVQPPAV